MSENIKDDIIKYKLWLEDKNKLNNNNLVGGYNITFYLLDNRTINTFISFNTTNNRTKAIYIAIERLLLSGIEYNVKSIGSKCVLE